MREPDHPFKVALASGGKVVEDRRAFVMVEKATTVTISEVVFKLAVGIRGGVADAYTWISQIAAAQWADDLDRAQTLWRRIDEVQGFLLEDANAVWLRPMSSVSQEGERLVTRQACSWLGVDPDSNFRRVRGRPQSAGEESDFIFVAVNERNEVTGKLRKDFMNVKAGTNLAELGLMRLIELLGALRTQGFNVDAEYLEAYLDAAARD